MDTFNHWHWLIVLLLVVLIFVLPKFKDYSGKQIDAAGHPVFSSVLVQGEEAENIDEQLPRVWRRWPAYIVTLVVLAAAIWVVTRP
jgi:uncharacterized membrane protein YwaF